MNCKKNGAVIFVGPMCLNGISSRGGDTLKNTILTRHLKTKYHKVYCIDTYRWEKKPWIFVLLFFELVLHYKTTLIVSANGVSSNRLFRFVKPLCQKRKTFYWAVGAVDRYFREGKFSIDTYQFLDGIFVQGKSMENTLRTLGLSNAVYVPNSKFMPPVVQKSVCKDGKVHFVFISRIEESKGCNYIFSAVDILNNKGYAGQFDVTFYGKIENKIYGDAFLRLVENYESVNYRGLLDLSNLENYNILAQYDVMLFPTYWPGEAFAGIFIDSYIAGLPVIASDWNLNAEIVEDGDTGWIIPVHDVTALASRMQSVIDNPVVISEMSKKCMDMAKQYDVCNVLSDENLVALGLL